MNGICAGGTGSFIDQMASLIQTDATGLNEYAKSYKAIYLSQPAVEYLQKQTSSLSSMREPHARIYPLQSFRPW